MGFTLTPSFYRSGHLGRVELNPDGAAVLTRAAGGLGRVQRPGQLQAVSPADPDQRALTLLLPGGRILPGQGGFDRHGPEHFGPVGQAAISGMPLV